MKIKSKVEDSYYEIKKICKALKEKNQKLRIKDEERFEDVPKHISDRDREGKVFHNSYMDFYLSVKYEFDQALFITTIWCNKKAGLIKTMIMLMLNLFNN